MDVKIGLADTPRELVISSAGQQDEVLDQVTRAIAADEPTVTLTDEKNRKFVVRTERISYVEVGSGTVRAVGFTS
ncbi:DUF3107 domain-containing protein [Corynebacterium mayonis]|uniref:DUF3107 domain-containing protein n=1 Tax=Corynebacterium mayonis TaxID=3062461 RepID=UPI0031407476